MKLNIKSAIQNAVVRTATQKESKPIFDTYIEKTLAKIDKSISDAKGRYHSDGKLTYKDPKPSQNWKVYGKADRIEDEKVRVWLKVGIKKVVLGDIYDDNGNLVKENADVIPVKNAQQNLVPVLEEMRSNIEWISNNRDSQEAKDFHKLAIASATPRSNSDAFEYCEKSDTFIEKRPS
jgi:hypothetical protein